MGEPSHVPPRDANRSQRNLHLSTSGVYYVKPKTKKRTAPEIEEYKKEYQTKAHKLSIEDLERRYGTDVENGLSQEVADRLLSSLGPNCLIAPPMKSRWLILAGFLFCGFATLLWIGAILSGIGYVINLYTGDGALDQVYLAGILVLVILVTGLFGYHQEAQNVAIIESFQKMTPKSATVVRDGEARIIPSEEVVVGDLVLLKGGEWIPADVRIIEAQGLKVENSAITGETNAQPRSAECTDDNVLETANLAFYSTSAVEGVGKGIVINTGDDTLIGHIAGLTSNLQKSTTPIRREINYFIKVITILALVIGVVFFIICLVFDNDFFTSFTYFIALVVANVPEGLPVTLTACMTLTAKRMASKNCLVKKLEAIETLGCCNVICSDKTGTLTQNKMTVSHVFINNIPYPVMYHAYPPGDDKATFSALARIAMLCNNATFAPGQNDVPPDKRKVIGDASESAILKSMEVLAGHVDTFRHEHPKVCEIPFNSSNKYQVSVHKLANKSFVVLMKGAPEKVLERCTTVLLRGKNESLSDSERKEVKKALYMLGNKGERVLAFADLDLDSAKYGPTYKFNVDSHNFPVKGLRFVGLISMLDPPRPSVPYAVSKCQSAGIRVIMVTGDHPITASAIAKQVGILSPQSVTPYDIAMKRNVSISMVTAKERSTCNAAVITGSDLREMSDQELTNSLKQYDQIVFARTSPQQKLKIVEAFQNMKLVVAVTGDGVNDSPALKKADIGVAMGITGSDVSKDAADMILLDDNFASIVTGIEEGRLIFDNLKKSIAYLLTSNVPEILPFVLMVVFHFPPQAGVIAVIVIDIGTDLWPAISLAYEKAEADIMLRSPRDPLVDKLVNHRLIFLTYLQIGVIQTCAAYTAYFNIMTDYGFTWQQLQGLYPDWKNHTKIVKDSFGQSWTYEERSELTYKCYSAFFLSIVITQIADLLICKTRRLSLFQQGMTNWVLNAGIIFEIALALFLVHCPYLNTAVQFSPISYYILLPTVPFALFIVLYDEIRKLCIRRFPMGIVHKETYY